MKTLTQTLIIILVMLLISGGFYLAFNNSSLAGGEGGERGELREGGRQAPPGGFGEREGGERGEREHGAFGFIEALGTLIKVTIVGTIIFWLKRGIETLNKRKTNPQPQG